MQDNLTIFTFEFLQHCFIQIYQGKIYVSSSKCKRRIKTSIKKIVANIVVTILFMRLEHARFLLICPKTIDREGWL